MYCLFRSCSVCLCGCSVFSYELPSDVFHVFARWSTTFPNFFSVISIAANFVDNVFLLLRPPHIVDSVNLAYNTIWILAEQVDVRGFQDLSYSSNYTFDAWGCNCLLSSSGSWCWFLGLLMFFFHICLSNYNDIQ